jgi:hypothetical protein
MERPYWDPEDYNKVMFEIRASQVHGNKHPMLSDPETAPVFYKLVDRDNITVVGDDSALGVKFKSDYMSEMFVKYRELATLYLGMDREDHYVYDNELVEILKFGMFLQVYYFRLGNEHILTEADSPESVNTLLKSNETVIINNFNNYLDFVNQERSFSAEALATYVAGIDEGFGFLLKTFPDANYSANLTKAKAMEQKASSAELKAALSRLISKLQVAREPE